MLTAKRLSGENFFTFKSLDVPLDNQGLVSIEGHNKDAGGSNGAGKTIPWDLLEHICYGTTSKKNVKGSSIVRGTGGYCGEFEFERDGIPYLIRQWRKHPQFGTGKDIGMEILQDGKNIAIGNNSVAIQKQCSNAIGMTKEEFLNCVILASNSVHVLQNGTPTERISFLTGPFRLDEYDYLYECVKEDLKEIDEKFQKLEVVEAKKERAEEAKKKIGSLRKLREDVNYYTSKRKTIRKNRKRFQVARDNEVENITSLQGMKTDSVTMDVDTVQADISTLEERIQKLHAKLKTKESYLEKLEEYWDIKKKLKGTDSHLDTDKLEKIRSQLLKDSASLENTIRDSRSTIEEFSDVSGKKKCPTCKRSFSSKDKTHYTKIVSEAKHTLKKSKISLEKTKEEIDELSTKLIKSRNYEKLKSQLPKGVDPKDSIDNIESSIEVLERKVEKLTKEHKDKTYQWAKAKEAQKIIKRLGIEVSDVEITLETSKQNKKKYDRQLDKMDKSIQDISSKISVAQTRLEDYSDLDKEIDRYNEKLIIKDKYEARKRILHALEQAYGPRGLKLDKIRKIIDTFQVNLPLYTNMLFTERNLKFVVKGNEKKLGFDIKRKLSQFDVAGLSGGESNRFSIALLFMVMFSMPPTKIANFVVLDEVDRNADEIGRKQLVGSMLPYLQDKISSIFVISHSKDISQAPIFKRKWIVSKKNEVSSLKNKRV